MKQVPELTRVCPCSNGGLKRRRNDVEERVNKTRLPRQRVMRKHQAGDVPLACAATPSRSRRNDTDKNCGCRDSALEVTPQRHTRQDERPAIS